ncbi:MAG: efflux RND transporter periplasmic adaptor subunit [Bacteroidaceae bacterium]|nr:efflux RND transporter periplasmic adaptor subunit [Bacteroidaceae bacterium]
MSREERNIIIVAATLVAIIAIVGIIGEFTLGRTSDIIQGEAEATEFRVSSKVPGRILRLYVREGDRVQAGDTVASIEAPDVYAQSVQAKALEEAATAMSEKVRLGTRPEQKKAAYELWQKARAALEIAQKTFTRINNLYESGVTTAQNRDEAEAALNAALATERAAKAEYELALKGAEIEDKEMAAAKLREAQGVVEEVDSYLNELALTAVKDGEVSEIFPNEGELVGSGAPIMNIAYLDDMWISFNIREDYLRNYNIGDRVTAYIPALDKEVTVEFYYMKDLGTYAVWRATKSSGEYDIKTFEIRARPMKKVNGLRPGMSVIIRR